GRAAHGGGGSTAKGAAEGRVLDELAAIYAHRPDHVVLIDDARLFLSPPPPDARQWPDFVALSEFLARQRPAPYVYVVGDVIVAGPWEVLPGVESHCQSRGLLGPRQTEARSPRGAPEPTAGALTLLL